MWLQKYSNKLLGLKILQNIILVISSWQALYKEVFFLQTIVFIASSHLPLYIFVIEDLFNIHSQWNPPSCTPASSI